MPSFNELDLTNSKVREGGPVLKTGCYLVETAGAEWVKTKAGTGWVVKVVFDDVNGAGQITETFNVFNPNAEAQRIGRDELKTMLTHGGHPNPDNPAKAGGVESINGLRLKIMVKADGTYTREGQTMTSYRVSRYLPADHPAALFVAPDGAAPAKSAAEIARNSQRPLDDEIPF